VVGVDRFVQANDRIVYCPGAFDLFHIGHLAFLEEAAKHGDYLIVGLHDDNTLMKVKGTHHPIQSVHERLLSCLAYKVCCILVMDD
jgi:ethanolamine-phosphate cytidylyltransferase